MLFKTRISQILRNLHLLHAAENLRYHWQRIKYQKQNKVFRTKHSDLKLPPDFFIYETYRLNVSEYFNDGYNTALEILDEIKKAYDISQKDMAILDWGCGPGRIVRHLPGILPQAKIYGTDYNEKYIHWCLENLSGIQFSLNNIDPHFAYPPSSFDAIIGISIFTHLSAKNQYGWINELYRVLKPGAVVFITTQGQAYRQRLLPAELEKFDNGELVVREGILEGNRLYSAFHPPAFMNQLIAGRFEVAEFIPGSAESYEPAQDSWLLRKLADQVSFFQNICPLELSYICGLENKYGKDWH